MCDCHVATKEHNGKSNGINTRIYTFVFSFYSSPKTQTHRHIRTYKSNKEKRVFGIELRTEKWRRKKSAHDV